MASFDGAGRVDGRLTKATMPHMGSGYRPMSGCRFPPAPTRNDRRNQFLGDLFREAGIVRFDHDPYDRLRSAHAHENPTPFAQAGSGGSQTLGEVRFDIVRSRRHRNRPQDLRDSFHHR